MNYKSKETIFFFLFFFLIVTGALYQSYNKAQEGMANHNYDCTLGEYPKSLDGPILPNSDFPHSGSKTTSTCSAPMIWRNYPQFEVGSYAQETNNIRYPPNPDQGTCTPADFCGALYKNREHKSNVVKPLGPVGKGTHPRVNYYRADTQNMLPYYNEGNIQY